MLLGAAIVTYSVLTVTLATVATDICICTRHVETRAFSCMNTRDMPSSFLYGNTPGEDCMPVAPNVITKHGWKAGILYNQVVYVQEDHNIARKRCSQTAYPPFTFDKGCPPTMKPGTRLNPTTPSTSSSTTTTPTTTTTTTTTPTTPTTRIPATATSPPTTATTKKVPHHVIPSSKCALSKLLQRLATKTPAAHPQGKLCNDNTHRAGDALMLEACLNPNINPFSWKKELKVIDHCYNIPKGEPIAIYAGPAPLPVYAHFWNCLGGNSFEIMFQACGSPPIIENASKRFTANMFYTISW